MYPKLYSNFDAAEFMEGAEGAFHAFVSFLHDKEWEVLICLCLSHGVHPSTVLLPTEHGEHR